MLRKIVPACLLMTALVVSGIPAAEALTAGTYATDWEGQPFTEFVDPLRRFVHYPVVDLDGDGFVTLTPTEYPETSVVPGDLSGLTNGAIESDMIALGITRQDVADQIALVLTPNPAYHAARDAAILDALNGDFLGVNTGLTGTDIDIAYYCGPSFSPKKFEWTIGIPLSADCPGGGIGGADMLFLATATRVSTFGDNIDDLDLVLDIKSTNGGYTDRFLAAGYKSHILGTESSPQKHIRGDLKFADLTGGTITVQAALSLMAGTWVAGDTLVYTYGGTPFAGKTVWLDFSSASTSYSLTAVVALPSGGFSVKLTLGSTWNVNQIRAFLDLGSAGRKVSLAAKGFPSTFKVGFTKKAGPSGSVEGNWYYVDLEHGNGVTSMSNLEIQGTYTDSSGSQFSFQLVGFPAKNRLRISLGNGNGGCDTLAVFSIDLTKRASTTSGRYRSVVVDGHKCDKDISLTVSNVHRMNIVSSKKDRWENDGEVLFSLGGTMWVMGDSAVHARAVLPWLTPNYDSQLDFHSNTEAKWRNRVGDFSAWASGTGPPVGTFILHDRVFTVNSYYWNIADTQLDSESLCLFRYASPDNRCA